ncbi:hypothetical protein CHARACLAT_029188 [Characodon lateralis]|uniref:Uncharacterized protein n=1 Tax=Characodon lateralis TaxID=208331 RepID=A0ABU7EE27_9TELE|nr:hypothetical protein [Characodon lateralis]
MPTSHDQTGKRYGGLPLRSPLTLPDSDREAVEETGGSITEFALERFSPSDDDIRFYTRFASYHHLLTYWHQIEPATKSILCAGSHSSASSGATAAPDKAKDPPHRPKRCLPMIDELFLFLV